MGDEEMKNTSLSIILISVFMSVFLSTSPVFAQTADVAIASGTTWLISAQYGHGIWAFDTPPDPLQTEFTADDYTKTYVRDTLYSLLFEKAV
jgi:hypothetical protein